MKTVKDIYRRIPSEGAVLDVGCFGYLQYYTAQELGLPSMRHAGVDYSPGAAPPPDGYDFRIADLNKDPLPFDDDSFDLIVCNHVIEHLQDGVTFFGECVRVCRPGGYIYLAAPSERSLLLPGFPFAYDQFHSLSFYDDPTHIGRPWSPQALHRLTKYWSCEVVSTGRQWSWKRRLAAPLLIPLSLILGRAGLFEATVWNSLGWASYLVARKPVDVAGKPAFRYYIPPNRR